jgi:hypothetical protein
MADAVAQKENLAQAQQSGLLGRKRFEILLSSAKNKHLLALEHLHSFVGSLAHAFKVGSEKAHNPDPSVLKIIAGSETIAHQDVKFAIDGLKQEDVNITGRGLPYIKDTLYPEDVIGIIEYLRLWLVEYYAKETKEQSWTIQVSTLNHEWQNAVERMGGAGLTNPIADFSQRELQEAVEELFAKIEKILEARTTDVKHDSIDDLVTEIKEKFAKEPEKTWQKIGLVLTKALADSGTNTPTILIPDKNLRVNDVREAINVIYDQISAQIEKKEGPEKPWDRASDETKTRFNSKQSPYFSINEIQEENTNINDTIKADAFIRFIDQLLEELRKVPEESEEGVDDEVDMGSSVSEQVTAEQEGFSTQENIIKRATSDLTMRSGEVFLSHFSNAAIDPNQLDQRQRDWLLSKLPEQIRGLLDQDGVQQEVEERIKNWITNTLTLEGDEGDRYKINNNQFKQLSNFLAQQFFTEYAAQFIEWMETVPTVAELEESEPVKPDVPEKKSVVPGVKTADEIDPEQRERLNIENAKAISLLTSDFLGTYFGEEGEFLRTAVYDSITQNLPADFTKEDLRRLRSQIFHQLQLDEKIFKLSSDYYDRRLGELGLNDIIVRTNFYNTLDSILVLIEDPHEYLNNLSDKQIIEYFGIEGTKLNIDELRAVLLGLIFVRRAHYFITRSTPIKPWLGSKNQKKTTQRLSQLRSFIKATGEEGVMALNTIGDSVDKSTIAEHRKKTVKGLYRELWLKTIAGKSTEELMDIYIFYGVDIIEIDFSAAPVPDGFGYSDMAQALNIENPTPTQAKKVNAAKQLFSKGKKRLGKWALAAVAPELAPILAALENLPVIGAAIQEIEEKAGDLLMKVGAALGIGLTALIGFLTKSIGAAVGALGGAVLGGFIGSIFGPVGTVIGVAAGTGIGTAVGYNLKGIGNWFKGLGGGSGAGAGGGGISTIGAGAGLGGGGPIIPNALVPATLGGGAAASMLMIASTGASMQHNIPNTSDIIPDAELNISRYVELDKSADITKIENNQNTTITYTITISPKDGYTIQVNMDETNDEWSYLGGDPISLPNKTQEILDQIPEEPFSDLITLTYSVDMSGVDVAVSNNFALSFEAVDESGNVADSISAFETVIIGDPEIGCLVPGPGGDSWSGTQTLNWSSSNWNRLLNVLAREAGNSTQFMSLVCSGDTPLEVYLLKGGFSEGYGGWAPSDFGGAKVGIYEYGMSFTENSLEYTLVHELGHIIDYRNPGLRTGYLQVPGGDSGCYTYPFPAMCSGAEAFAESVSLYIVYDSYYFSYTGHGNFDFPGKHPDQYKWLTNNVFGN